VRVEPVVTVSPLLPIAVVCGHFMTGFDQNVVIIALRRSDAALVKFLLHWV
jgi:hypothetical protein